MITISKEKLQELLFNRQKLGEHIGRMQVYKLLESEKKIGLPYLHGQDIEDILQYTNNTIDNACIICDSKEKEYGL